MVDDMLQQNWSTLHSPSIESIPPEQPDGPSWQRLTSRKRSYCGSPVLLHWCGLSLCLRHGVPCFRDLLLNSFEYILHNSIASHGMKIEMLLSFPFHHARKESCATTRALDEGGP